MPTIKTTQKTRSNYTIVLVLLVVFTVLEVATSFMTSSLKLPLLLTMAGIKASLVVLYFMHLRHDSRLFALMFLIGALIIIPLFLTMTLVLPLL
jgi:cytochrome c oxidase subunit 4